MFNFKSAAVCISLVGLAACGGGGSSSTPPASSNPASILVTVTNNEHVLQTGITVSLSKDIEANAFGQQVATGVLQTAVTNSAGQATLTPPGNGDYCVSAASTISSGNAAQILFAGNCYSQPLASTYTLTFND